MSSTIIEMGDSDDDVPVRVAGSKDDPVVLSDTEDDAEQQPKQTMDHATCDAEQQGKDDATTRDCPVCMDTLGVNGPARALGCVHVYCGSCIRQHIVTQLEHRRLPLCPVCKREIPAEEQRACGVDSHEITGGTAYAIDMFAAPDDEPLRPTAALSAAFPHASARDVRRNSNRDPMLLLDRHMDHQRRDRNAIASRRGPRGGDPGSRVSSLGQRRSAEPTAARRRDGAWPYARVPVSWP